MQYEWLVGWRYLFSKKGDFLVSIITIISMIGVALGVTALLVVQAVVSGFENDFRKKILGNNAHLIVVEAGQRLMTENDKLVDKIAKTPGVKAASPFLYEEVLLRGKSDRATGVLLYGIDPQRVGQVIALEKDMVEGKLTDLNRSKSLPGIIVGAEIADHTLFLLLDDDVDVMSPSGEISPLGMGPKLRRFRLAGKFQSGLYEYDAHTAYIDLQQAQRFLGVGKQISGIQVSLKNALAAPQVAEKVAKQLGDRYFVRTWMELNRDLFSAFRLEKTVFFIVMTMIILVAAFNIVGTLIVVVTEKHREIAILTTMGARRSSIVKIFIATGSAIGLVGTAAGLLLATILIIILRDYFPFPLNAKVYQVANLPIVFRWLDFVWVAIAALGISFVATLYPAYKAATLKPVDGLRHE